jgi:hypothetical protein
VDELHVAERSHLRFLLLGKQFVGVIFPTPGRDRKGEENGDLAQFPAERDDSFEALGDELPGGVSQDPALNACVPQSFDSLQGTAGELNDSKARRQSSRSEV